MREADDSRNRTDYRRKEKKKKIKKGGKKNIKTGHNKVLNKNSAEQVEKKNRGRRYWMEIKKASP